MHAVKVDRRKIMAAGLVIAAVFAAVAITTNVFYLGQIQALVRNTTTTSVMELASARARYLDECLVADQNSVKSLAHFISHATPAEARGQVEDFVSTHKAAAAWIRTAAGESWCTSNGTDLYDPALEDQLFGPALAGQTGSSEMYVGHNGERRIMFYAPIVAERAADESGGADAGQSQSLNGKADGAEAAGDILGAVYVSYPTDELQNSYGTTYSSAGATFVVDSTGTIVLDANRSADEAVQGSLVGLVSGNAGNAQVTQLLSGIAADTSGSLVMALDGTDQFVFYTPISAKSGWSLVTILPLSVVEADGAKIVGITNQMTATLAVAVALAVAAIVALLVYRRRREQRYEQYIRNVYSAIGSNINTAIFIVDRKERLVEAVFENTQDILGIPAGRFFMRDELSSNEAYAKVTAIVHSGAVDDARSWEFEASNPALGRSQWLRITARPVTLAEREKTIFSLTDVTDDHEIRARLERAAAAAEEASRAKSSFLSSMSHDIRTPMNAILGFSTLIDREADNAELVRDYNRKIATSGQHLLGLINDVLDMSKIESGKTTLAIRAFSLSGTVSAVEAMMRQQTDAKGQSLAVEIEGVSHDRLLGDEGRLRQILMNLLSNAMKYTPEGGDILFRAEGAPAPDGLQHVRFTVRDNGIGMSQDYLATVFDSFTREESSLTNKVQGTGLGMAITKSLVDLMGGAIAVESALGEGSTFTVDLDFPPADDAGAGTESAAGSPAPGQATSPLARKHFLVAEDNELNAEIIDAILGIHDATCVVAANGKEALDAFKESAPGTFDMIFMDVQMPVMDGHAATRAIRALDRPDARSIPIIAMTANAFAEDEREALASGMSAHVAKPIDIHLLESVVADLSQ